MRRSAILAVLSSVVAGVLVWACTDSPVTPPCDSGCNGADSAVDGTSADANAGDASGMDAADAGSATDAADAAKLIDWDAASAPWAQALGDGILRSLDVDGNQNVLVGGNVGAFFFMQKMDAAGNMLWKKSVGSGSDCNVVAFDGAGAAYGAGYVVNGTDFGGGAVAGTGWYVVKYDAAGGWKWQYGPFTHTAILKMRAKSNGNLVMVGSLDSPGDNFGSGVVTPNGRDGLLVEITGSKTLVRAKTYGDNGAQTFLGLALDSSDNLFISGYFDGTINFGGADIKSFGNGTSNVFIVKLDPSAGYLAQMNTGTASSNTSISALATDAMGRLYVAGMVYDNTNFDLGGGNLVSAGGTDVVVGLLDGSLKHVWSKRYGDSSGQVAIAGASDPSGAVAVTGQFSGMLDFGLGALNALGSGVFLARMDSAGKTLASFGATPMPNLNGAYGSSIAYLSWPDFVIAGTCGGGYKMTLPSGQIQCAPNGTAFCARLKP